MVELGKNLFLLRSIVQGIEGFDVRRIISIRKNHIDDYHPAVILAQVNIRVSAPAGVVESDHLHGIAARSSGQGSGQGPEMFKIPRHIMLLCTRIHTGLQDRRPLGRICDVFVDCNGPVIAFFIFDDKLLAAAAACLDDQLLDDFIRHTFQAVKIHIVIGIGKDDVFFDTACIRGINQVPGIIIETDRDLVCAGSVHFIGAIPCVFRSVDHFIQAVPSGIQSVENNCRVSVFICDHCFCPVRLAASADPAVGIVLLCFQVEVEGHFLVGHRLSVSVHILFANLNLVGAQVVAGIAPVLRNARGRYSIGRAVGFHVRAAAGIIQGIEPIMAGIVNGTVDFIARDGPCRRFQHDLVHIIFLFRGAVVSIQDRFIGIAIGLDLINFDFVTRIEHNAVVFIHRVVNV